MGGSVGGKWVEERGNKDVTNTCLFAVAQQPIVMGFARATHSYKSDTTRSHKHVQPLHDDARTSRKFDHPETAAMH